ncbi:MAG: hypothetical protein J7L34_04090 [Thermotogaceae bacterium]|nr:hypothetical protein [Thermotogaceae bacterium]
MLPTKAAAIVAILLIIITTLNNFFMIYTPLESYNLTMLCYYHFLYIDTISHRLEGKIVNNLETESEDYVNESRDYRI